MIISLHPILTLIAFIDLHEVKSKQLVLILTHGWIQKHLSLFKDKKLSSVLDKYVPMHVCWLFCVDDVVSLDKQGMFPLWEQGVWKMRGRGFVD